VFLFISGFLLARDRSPSFVAFVSGRLRRIAVPGLFWMTIALAYKWWRGGFSTELLRHFVLFDIEGQFYFLVVLAMLTAAAYPIRHASTRTVAVITGVAFVAGLGMITWYEQQGIAGDLAIFTYRNPVIWAYSFTFGLLANRMHGSVSWGRGIESAAVAGMVAMFVVYICQGETHGYPVSYFGVTVYVFGCFGLVYPVIARVVVRAAVRRLLATPLAWLAPLSFVLLGWLSSMVLGARGLRSHGDS